MRQKMTRTEYAARLAEATEIIKLIETYDDAIWEPEDIVDAMEAAAEEREQAETYELRRHVAGGGIPAHEYYVEAVA